MKYRPEIDGLRALAVIPVIFYHGKFNLFQGGFIGVDIFFVISGYLITRIIFSEIFQSSFSILNFYERRARRILPALFIVLLFSLVLGWLLLPPMEFRSFGQSLGFVSIFASNAFFWLKSEYFEMGSDLKPLIHTWSLGVEEQFYILFPLIAIYIFALNKKMVFPIIFSLFFISLYLSIVNSAPANDSSARQAAFFLLHTRAWELMLGSLLFLTTDRQYIFSNKLLNNLFSFAGLLLIVFSISFFNDATPFPSFYALMPTIGAALLIVFSLQGTFTHKLLTLKPIIFIGLISYSAYLWHQPLLVFSRFYFVGELTPFHVLSIFILTILLAYLSWRFLEQPFRDKEKISRKTIFLFSAMGCFAFGAIGLSIHLNDGFKNRFSSAELQLLNFQQYEEREELYRNRQCFLRSEQDERAFLDICTAGPIYIWGDSHAASISYGLRSLADITQFTSSRCPPILEFEVHGRPHCKSINEYIFSSINEQQPKIVFLHSNWISEWYKGFDDAVFKTLTKLTHNYPSIKFYMLGGLPQWFPSLPNTMLKAGQLLDGQETYIENQLFSTVQAMDLRLEDLVEKVNKDNIQFISMLELLCKETKCLSQASFSRIEPIAFDYGHLTGSGSIKASSLILDNINYQYNEYQRLYNLAP